MRLLMAEDEPVAQRALTALLGKWGYEVVVTTDGQQAWEALQAEAAPHLVLLDWQMPHLDGVDVCRLAREAGHPAPLYMIMLTMRDRKEDVVAALESGADDYLTKPCEPQELRARLRVGERVLSLQTALADHIRGLEQALAEVQTLQGLLPICCYCKKIRGDDDYWQQLEAYISGHTGARFTHGYCPECYERYVRPQVEQLRAEKARRSLQAAEVATGPEASPAPPELATDARLQELFEVGPETLRRWRESAPAELSPQGLARHLAQRAQQARYDPPAPPAEQTDPVTQGRRGRGLRPPA